MAMERGGSADAATLDRSAGSGTSDGSGMGEDILLSALGADEETSSAGNTAEGSVADAAGEAQGETDLSQHSESDEQGSDSGDEQGKPRRDRIQERIDKLTSRFKSAEERAEKAEAELQKLRGGTSQARGFDPVEDDPAISELATKAQAAQREADNARQLRRQLKTDPDRVLAFLKSKGREFADESEAADFLEDYEERQRDLRGEIRGDLAQKREQLAGTVRAQQQAWNSAVDARMPWLSDAEDPRHSYMQKAQSAYPWIAKLPAGRAALAFLADLVHEANTRKTTGKPGAQQPQQRQAPQGQNRPTVRPASAGTGGPVGRPDSSDRSGRRAEFERRLNQNPDDDEALAGLLEDGLP